MSIVGHHLFRLRRSATRAHVHAPNASIIRPKHSSQIGSPHAPDATAVREPQRHVAQCQTASRPPTPPLTVHCRSSACGCAAVHVCPGLSIAARTFTSVPSEQNRATRSNQSTESLPRSKRCTQQNSCEPRCAHYRECHHGRFQCRWACILRAQRPAFHPPRSILVTASAFAGRPKSVVGWR